MRNCLFSQWVRATKLLVVNLIKLSCVQKNFRKFCSFSKNLVKVRRLKKEKAFVAVELTLLIYQFYM